LRPSKARTWPGSTAKERPRKISLEFSARRTPGRHGRTLLEAADLHVELDAGLLKAWSEGGERMAGMHRKGQDLPVGKSGGRWTRWSLLTLSVGA
jgi:hypothetical protein